MIQQTFYEASVMAKDNKHNENDPSIRGGSRRHEMQNKSKKYYKGARGRPYRYKRLLAEEEAAPQAELEAIQKELQEKQKAEADAAKKASAKKSSKKKKSEEDAD